MRCVPGRERGTLREHYSGNHGVTQVAGAAVPLSGRHQLARVTSSENIKPGHSLSHFRKEFVKRLSQLGSPPASY
jgi:hypothetical protein